MGPEFAGHWTPPSYGEPTVVAPNLDVEDLSSVQCTVFYTLVSRGPTISPPPYDRFLIVSCQGVCALVSASFILFLFFFSMFWAFEPLATHFSCTPARPLFCRATHWEGEGVVPGYSRTSSPLHSVLSTVRLPFIFTNLQLEICLLAANFSTWRLPH